MNDRRMTVIADSATVERHTCDNCDGVAPESGFGSTDGRARPAGAAEAECSIPRDVKKATEPDDGCDVDNSQGFHIGEEAYHDRHGQGWISRYIEGGQTAIVIFLSAGTRAVDVRHLRPSSFGTKIPKPHVAFAMALQSQRQTMGVGLDEMPDAALGVERGRLPFDDANIGLSKWLDLIKVNAADRIEWQRRAEFARREWGRQGHDGDALLRNMRAAAAVVVDSIEACALVKLLHEHARPDGRAERALLAVRRAAEHEQTPSPEDVGAVLAWCDTLRRAGGADLAGLAAREAVR